MISFVKQSFNRFIFNISKGRNMLIMREDSFVIQLNLDKKSKTGELLITFREEGESVKYPLNQQSVTYIKNKLNEAFMEYCDDHTEIKPCDECGKIDKDLNDIMNQPVRTQDIYPSGPMPESDESYLLSKFNKLYPNLDIKDVDGHRAWRVFQESWKAAREEGFPTPPTLQPMSIGEFKKVSLVQMLSDSQREIALNDFMARGFVVKTKEDEEDERFQAYHKEVVTGLERSLKNGIAFAVFKIKSPKNRYDTQWQVAIDCTQQGASDCIICKVWDKEFAVRIADHLNSEADLKYKRVADQKRVTKVYR